jgi:hypothetical protein
MAPQALKHPAITNALHIKSQGRWLVHSVLIGILPFALFSLLCLHVRNECERGGGENTAKKYIAQARCCSQNRTKASSFIVKKCSTASSKEW